MKIAERHELAPGVAKRPAAPFWPSTASYEDCELVYQHGALKVRLPALEVIFVIKLYRSDLQDREDLFSLWSLCGFRNADEAARAFQQAYPHAPEVVYLAASEPGEWWLSQHDLVRR